MKKLFTSIVIIMMIILGFTYANAYSETYTIELKNISNKNWKKFDIYILLPKQYILFAIENDDLDIEYDGANTLIENYIPSIYVNKENVKSDTYTENGIEYIQILLEKNSEGNYEFDILSDYKYMDIKLRVKNIDKDYIMHIENFKIEDGKCQIEYNYDNDTVKQPDVKIIPIATKILIAILIATIVIGTIAYIKQRR